MIRILNVEPSGYSPVARAVLQELGEVVERELDRETLLMSIADFDVVIARLANQIDREIISRAKQLKVIVTATTGLDHIDVDYAKTQGITILSLKGEYEYLQSITSTPEHTWALLLSLMRQIPTAFASVRAGEWSREKFKGHTLKGKRLGILGLGRVGVWVAQYALAFGMYVFAYDPYKTDWLEGVKKCKTMDKLLMQSDILSIHIPLNENTMNLIGAHELSLLPQYAVVVNTSRGEVIDENALLQSLEDGQIAGAALDFLPFERNKKKRDTSSLLRYAQKNDNLLITPHLAGATYESMEDTEIFMAKKLSAYFKTRGLS